MLFQVRVTNLLDRSVPDVSVTAKSFSTSDDSVTLFDNKAFDKPNSKDMIVLDNEVARGYIEAQAYGLNVMAASPKRGMFKCIVDLNMKGKHFLKKASYKVDLKVLSKVMVEDVEIVVTDKDHASGSPLK